MSGPPSMRERQLTAIRQMLNLNAPLPSQKRISEPVWKILVYDEVGQDILAPIVQVKELRDMGVTLHMLLRSNR